MARRLLDSNERGEMDHTMACHSKTPSCWSGFRATVVAVAAAAREIRP